MTASVGHRRMESSELTKNLIPLINEFTDQNLSSLNTSHGNSANKHNRPISAASIYKNEKNENITI